MATVFSRDAWRCVWHMIQVGQFFIVSVLCTPLFVIPQVALLMQNDLVHGWGLDFALRKCVEVRCRTDFVVALLAVIISDYIDRRHRISLSTQPAHEKIGVVDSQWIIHQVVPSLGNQVRGQPKCVAMAECLVSFCDCLSYRPPLTFSFYLAGPVRERQGTMGRGKWLFSLSRSLARSVVPVTPIGMRWIYEP